MNILFVAVGSRGDVQPYVALGRAFRDAGHDVRVLAPPDFRALVEEHGLAFFDTGGSMEAVAREMRADLERGRLITILRKMRTAARAMAVRAAEGALPAGDGVDLVVGGLGGLFLGVALAERIGVPFVPAYLYPFEPTRAFPAVLTPPGLDALVPRALRPLTHRIARQAMWQPTRTADDLARATVFGTGRSPRFGPFAEHERRGALTLYGFSPSVVPPPPDWSPAACVTGYWPLPPPSAWTPPDDLAAFLAAGPPPVYVGFGSMAGGARETATGLVVEALRRSGQRGVLASAEAGRLPESVLAVGSVPHEWLFARTAAVVHHGGAGTTAAAVRAGVPAVVVPFMGDQPFWGRRVQALGVGPAPIRRSRLTAARLAAALDVAVTDRATRERAAALGERVRREDGLARAVSAVESAFARAEAGRGR